MINEPTEAELQRAVDLKMLTDTMYKLMAEIQSIQKHLDIEPVWIKRKDERAKHMMGYLYEKPTGNPNWSPSKYKEW